MSFGAMRDRRTAEESAPQANFRCAANGCPNLWSIDRGLGQNCRWHDAAETHLWPQITREQLQVVAEMARHREPAPVHRYTHGEKTEILQSMRVMFAAGLSRPAKQWAHALKQREEDGERLTKAQRDMWRAALGPERAEVTE